MRIKTKTNIYGGNEMRKIELQSINVNGVRLPVRTFKENELKADYFGPCNMVPANDDRLVMAKVDGVEIVAPTFEDLVSFLGWNAE